MPGTIVLCVGRKFRRRSDNERKRDKHANDRCDQGLMAKETAFEFLPLHEVIDLMPMPPETNVIPPSGGLKTETNAIPGCAMSATVITATNWRLLMNVVTRNDAFQLTNESRRKSFPLTARRNWSPPAVALLGETELAEGKGGQVPQESTVPSTIARTAKTDELGKPAIGLHL